MAHRSLRLRGKQIAKRIGTKRRRSSLEALEVRRVLAAPTLATITDLTVYAGAPLHIALDGFDADGDSLSYAATSSNAALISQITQNNRSLRITVAGFGEMEFELFDDLAPATAARIAQLAQQGFYDDLIFHRVISNFMIQGGDPTGTGSGGSGLKFNDEFNVNLQHTSSGILSMAKSLDDTNDSQFFITAGPTRHLDFNHSIFGFLTKGESVRQAIASVPVNSQDRPISNVVMSSVDVFVDEENGVLRLIAPQGASGVADVTVTVSDGHGGTAQRTFRVTILPDTVASNNSNPFMAPMNDVAAVANTPMQIQVPAIDAEGNPISYLASSSNANVEVSFAQAVATPNGQQAFNILTITPKNNFVGVATITLKVHAVGVTPLANESNVDVSRLSVTVTAPPAPSGVQLLSDTGLSTTDLITRRNNTAGNLLQFRVTGVTPGTLVVLRSGGTVIGEAIANGATVDITSNGLLNLADGQHSITATQAAGSVVGPASAALSITIDSTVPVFSSAPITAAIAGQGYGYDVGSDEETAGTALYSLPNALTGMSINAQTGMITWTPHASQSGPRSVTVRVSDLAGNTADQTFVVDVANSAPVLAAMIDRTINEMNAVTFAASATDSNLPADKLTYTLEAGAPAGAAINPLTGLFSWTPSEAQGPGDFVIGIRVTDAGGLFATQSFAVHVDEVFQAPVLNPIGRKDGAINQPLSFTVSAIDDDLPVEALTYSIVDFAPGGATINPVTGVFSWTPNDSHKFQTFTARIRVTDAQGLFDEETIQIGVNAPPVVDPIADLIVDEGTSVVFPTTATHAFPIQWSLDAGAPAGATVDPITGVFSWNPSEADGPGTFTITLRATDTQQLSGTTTFQITVEEVNQAPLIANVVERFVFPGGSTSFQVLASDFDLPGNGLTFSLEEGAPEGASIDPVTGAFTYSPPDDAAEGNYLFTVRVTDDGLPPLSTTRTFQITVTNIGFLFWNGGRAVEQMDSLFDNSTESLLAQSAVNLLNSGGRLNGGGAVVDNGAAGGAPNFQQGPDTGVPQDSIAPDEMKRPKDAPPETDVDEDGNTSMELPQLDQIWRMASFLKEIVNGEQVDRDESSHSATAPTADVRQVSGEELPVVVDDLQATDEWVGDAQQAIWNEFGAWTETDPIQADDHLTVDGALVPANTHQQVTQHGAAKPAIEPRSADRANAETAAP